MNIKGGLRRTIKEGECVTIHHKGESIDIYFERKKGARACDIRFIGADTFVIDRSRMVEGSDGNRSFTDYNFNK